MDFKLDDLVEVTGWKGTQKKNWIIADFASNNSEAVLIQYFSGNQAIVKLSELKHQEELEEIQTDQKTQKTWQAQIYCGRERGRTGELISIDKIYQTCQEYVDKIGWCVTVTPTMFIYRNGHEPGVIIGVAQYPRFPLPEEVLRARTLELARKLLSELQQHRVSVCFPDETVLIKNNY